MTVRKGEVVGKKPKLELSQCQLCGNMSSHVWNEMDATLGGQIPELEAETIKVGLSFSDEEDNPKVLCSKCASLVVGCLAMELAREHESMEAQADEHIDKH